MPDSLDFEKTLSISFKPRTRSRTIKKIIGKPISKYVTNIRKSITPTGKKNETHSFLNSVAGSITFRKIN